MKIKRFNSSEGLDILVGQDDASNDYLSIKLADATDLWFHVAGFPGSHVVLRNPHKDAGKESLQEAAALAAWFSKMRNAKKVAVHYCPAQYVSKSPNDKAGTVHIKKMKKITVTPNLPATWEWFE